MHELAELEERRAFECRLTPERALETLDAAEDFLRNRGLLTRTAGSALPSLFAACHEEPYARSSRGFGQWPATKFPWFAELGSRGHLNLPIHGGKSVLVTGEVAELLDPICRAELARVEAAGLPESRLLRHLAETGPSELDDLQTELSLTPKELKQLRHPLERCGAIVSRALVYEQPHRHTSELARWDQVRPEARQSGVDPRRGLGDLLCAGVRAAVVAPEKELARWFSWRRYWDDAIVEELVRDGRLRRVDRHVAVG